MSSAIGEARRFTRDQLNAWGVADLTETAILMISELVTNAILHGGDGAVLTLVLTDIKFRAEVRDSSPVVPVMRGYSDTATTGRGMVIVDALAADWGSFPVEGGKIVWFELSAGDGRPQHDTTGRKSSTGRGTTGRRPSGFMQPPEHTGQEGGGRPRPRSRRATIVGSGREN